MDNTFFASGMANVDVLQGLQDCPTNSTPRLNITSTSDLNFRY